ncbi:glucose 1-dehydrogenase [Alloactinosynnema sp. L-07]|uniref:SDR family NAD(P)-dependent oxidoreductase n=1 Tax=Alloactinosynnema sp. L-07 TaxID=1653480 RepID=UPI00065EFADF|nr:SDR family NAD(P)-dependent oxidoreductase [Alloactinosynnema sp. L-07]CRK62068.1 glucose 1-dehydrogenase [Alloactinosynnema sp. L-07]
MRTALITGGTGGLGAAVTTAFLDAGWRVVVPWVAESELGRLPEHAALDLVKADLFDPAEVGACVERAATADAPLGAVVNLVGGFAMGPRLHETPIDEFDRLLRLNLRPTYLVCQAALPKLIAAGGGAVVCVSAKATERPFPGASAYLTAKTAVVGLVKAMAAEYGRDGVRVNAVLPGIIDTPGNRADDPDADRSGWVRPQEIAEAILFLCGQTPITGAAIPVAGTG